MTFEFKLSKAHNESRKKRTLTYQQTYYTHNAQCLTKSQIGSQRLLQKNVQQYAYRSKLIRPAVKRQNNQQSNNSIHVLRYQRTVIAKQCLGAKRP